MLRKIIGVLLFATLGAHGGLAQEDEPYKYKNWTTESKNLGSPFNQSCVSYTEKEVNDQLWRLSFVVSAEQRPNAVFVISAPEGVVATELEARSSGSRSLFDFARLQDVDSNFAAQAFWQKPENVGTFYYRLRKDSAVKVMFKDAAGESEHFYFSLSGSAKNFDELMERCALKDAVNKSFFDTLEDAEASAIDPIDSSVSALWSEQLDAQAAYLALSLVKENLATLQAQMDPLVKAQQDYLRRSGGITEELEDANEEKSEKQASLQSTVNSISSQQNELAAEEQLLEPAQANLLEKENAYKPVRLQSRPYFDAVESAENYKRSVESQYSSVERRIRDTESEISSLDREKSSLDREISSLESRYSRARSDLLDAEREYSRFHFDSEVESLRRSDSRYQSLQRAIENGDRELQRLQNDVRDARHRHRDAENRLASCQQVQGQDCSAQRQAVQSTNARVNSLERDLQACRSQLAQYRNALESRDYEIRRAVSAKRDRLLNAVAEAREEADQIDRSISSKTRRRSQVSNDLSSKRSLLSQQRQERDATLDRLSVARQRLDRAEQDLANFKASTGYDQLRTAYYSAKERVDEIAARISRLERSLSSLASLKARLEGRLAELSTEIEQLLAEAAQNSEELEQIESELAPLRAQKASLIAERDEKNGVFLSTASYHKGILESLNASGAETQQLQFVMPVNSLGKQSSQEFWDWL